MRLQASSSQRRGKATVSKEALTVSDMAREHLSIQTGERTKVMLEILQHTLVGRLAASVELR